MPKIIAKLLASKSFRGSGALVLSLMFANAMNFVFNAYLGRALTIEDFGTLTLVNSLWYIVIIPLNAIGVTTNHTVARLQGQDKAEIADGFYFFIKRKTLWVSTTIAVLWFLLSPWTAGFFQLEGALPMLTISGVMVLGTLVYLNRGYLQGALFFEFIAITFVTESIAKFIAVVALSVMGLGQYAYLSLPLSLFVAFGLARMLVNKKVKETKKNIEHSFPSKFFLMLLVSSSATTAFLTFDVILVKHYFDPVLAGQYSLLSLIGKMVYFLGSILNGVIFTYSSRAAGNKVESTRNFYKMLLVSTVLTAFAVLTLGFFGSLTVPLLLGEKVKPILPLLPIYTLGLGLFTIAGTLVNYHMVFKEYFYAYVSLSMALLMMGSIAIFHASLLQVSYTILAVSTLSLVIILTSHLYGKK